jgi:hypothetical protein
VKYYITAFDEFECFFSENSGRRGRLSTVHLLVCKCLIKKLSDLNSFDNKKLIILIGKQKNGFVTD